MTRKQAGQPQCGWTVVNVIHYAQQLSTRDCGINFERYALNTILTVWSARVVSTVSQAGQYGQPGWSVRSARLVSTVSQGGQYGQPGWSVQSARLVSTVSQGGHYGQLGWSLWSARVVSTVNIMSHKHTQIQDDTKHTVTESKHTIRNCRTN